MKTLVYLEWKDGSALNGGLELLTPALNGGEAAAVVIGDCAGAAGQAAALGVRTLLVPTGDTSPDAVAGVTARLKDGSGYLEYDGVWVETGPLDESGMSPMEAVPVLLRYATEGFIAEWAMEETGEGQVLRVICRDPEAKAGEGQECSLWFDPDSHALLRGELSQDGFTVIQCVFSGFATME